MLTRLSVKNYRCIRDVTVDFAPLSVLIGKNDTGKSTLLNAILASHDVERGHAATAVGRDCQMRAEHTIVVDGVEARVNKTLIREGGRLQVAVEGGGVKGAAPPIQHEHRRQLVQRQTRVARMQLAPRSLAALGPIATSAEDAPMLATDGSGLVALLDFILGTERDDFAWIESELSRLMPAVAGVRLLPAQYLRDDTIWPGKEIRIKTSDGAVVPTSDVSEGVLLMLGFLTLARAPNRAAILLMEEPENGLHPRLLREAVRVLQAISESGTQIILTTHSPYLLDYVPPDCVRVFHRDEKHGVRVKPLTALPGFDAWRADGASLGEMWFNAGEEALFDDASAPGE